MNISMADGLKLCFYFGEVVRAKSIWVLWRRLIQDLGRNQRETFSFRGKHYFVYHLMEFLQQSSSVVGLYTCRTIPAVGEIHSNLSYEDM